MQAWLPNRDQSGVTDNRCCYRRRQILRRKNKTDSHTQTLCLLLNDNDNCVIDSRGGLWDAYLRSYMYVCENQHVLRVCNSYSDTNEVVSGFLYVMDMPKRITPADPDA